MIDLKLSNIYIQITCDSAKDHSVLTALHDYLSVFEYKTRYNRYKGGLEKYKHTTHFFNLRTGMVLTGFLPEILNFFEKRGILNYTITDLRVNLPTFSGIIAKDLGNITLRDYQYECVKKANFRLSENLYFPRGIISGATNAGKSIIFSSILSHIEGVKALLFIHNRVIFEQMCEDLAKLFGKVGVVSSGKILFEDITVCMEQTVFTALKQGGKKAEILLDAFSNYNTLIVDECHRSGSLTYQNVLSHINAGARFFFSGTALENSDQIKNWSIIGQSGPVLHTISNLELIKLNVSRKPIIRLYDNPTPVTRFSSFEAEQEYLVENSPERMSLLLDLVGERLDKYILIFCIKIQHGQLILKNIQKRFPQVRSAFIHGSSPDKEYRLKDFKTGKLEILISSIILKEGVNIPITDTLIYAAGGKSVITLKQVIGRALRAKEGAESVEIIDFYDKGRWVTQHSEARLRLYEKEKFEIIRYKL